ncbi:transcription initiation factor IIF, beta subunit-domain-containing protein [Zychaea mexicana]|uniref:transcription initiation factor IIF, beta subunit-domain-containing protein n=1 Tax=Zychaea mexicana TaxID=64656 RepID=UPI0022FEA861|nr:transcription initiation factor IIF, beta subunit-domain-containing protein [Zychaea mexicana]KAI9488212.1 transcription initiation factor IIF, beta subunit-domain-containing protein [Zychaea mexicana]
MSDNTTNPDVDALFEDDPGPLDEVVDDDDDDLKLDSADTKVWLVKVPKFLADKWKKVDQDNVNLGSVRIYSEAPPGRSSAISLVLPENETDNIPREYSIHIPQGEVMNKYVFTQGEHGVKSINGTVHHECSATPTQFEPYRGIMRKRVLDAGTPQRTVQVLGQNNQPVFVPGASSAMQSTGFSDFIVVLHMCKCISLICYIVYQQSKKQKTDNKEKATRMPRNELMDVLFAAFEKYPYWSFKGILEHTKQPSQYLKEVLSEICILNKRGPYASNYQLKPEYKQRPSAAELASAAAASSSKDGDDGSNASSGDEEDEEVMETINV